MKSSMKSSMKHGSSPSPFLGVLTLDPEESLALIPTITEEEDAAADHLRNPKDEYVQISKTQKNSSSLPLLAPTQSSSSASSLKASTSTTSTTTSFRSRKGRHKRKRHRSGSVDSSKVNLDASNTPKGLKCCRDRTLVRSTLSCMNIVAKMLCWCSAVASAAAVVWYSYELKNNGTDPHLIAWFSAGAFVLLGFPVSMYGIVMHLANYNQPNVQCYIVRILWMVPIYSIESWLCLRYKDYAIYIETLRDCYESYVLYSFLQFLIQVLGGEEALILMLKDKSPTRGVHMWGLQWCVKPWIMGQPIRKTYEEVTAAATTTTTTTQTRSLKRVHWTSPFFVKCKFGVLQYVLLKFVVSFVVMILERNHIYKEGNFTPKGAYLYICILTNLSQCWALYCLIFFYYATKNELSSIRPVGKFLSVKALVFFTWWQSVCISMLYQMDLIPHYNSGVANDAFAAGHPLMPLSQQDALALDEHGGSILTMPPAAMVIIGVATEWSAEDVAKGLQDYLICIEMFVAAIVHLFVFSHTEYDPQAVEARASAMNQTPIKDWNKRLGRKWKEWDNKSGYSGFSGTTNASSELELLVMVEDTTTNTNNRYRADSADEDDLRIHPLDRMATIKDDDNNNQSEGELNDDEDDSSYSVEDLKYDDDDSFQDVNLEDVEAAVRPVPTKKQGFVSALLDSTIPQDLRDNTVGIIKGDYVVEKKTLLHHAATSDSYDLFSRFPKRKTTTIPAKKNIA